MEWQNSSATILAQLSAAGAYLNKSQITADNTTSNSTSLIAKTNFANATPIIIQGATSQSANLQEWQNNTSTALASVDSVGNVAAQAVTATGVLTTNANLRVNNSALGTVAAIVKGAAGQTADLERWQNNSASTLASVDSAGNFATQALTATGVLTTNQNVRVNNGTAGTVAAIIKGAAGQTANLEQWQNSAGTVLTAITSTGQINFASGNTAVVAVAGTTAIPALGAGFIVIQVAGVDRKIAFYAS
jgi:acylphosphatase